jgi:hypothetical protein
MKNCFILYHFNPFFKFQLLWWDANRDCRSRGMRLVSIESPEEDAAITSVLGKQKT